MFPILFASAVLLKSVSVPVELLVVVGVCLAPCFVRAGWVNVGPGGSLVALSKSPVLYIKLCEITLASNCFF